MEQNTQKVDREKMMEFYKTDPDFKNFIDRNMKTYQKSLDEELDNPIAHNYYRSLLPGGCNHRGENGNR